MVVYKVKYFITGTLLSILIVLITTIPMTLKKDFDEITKEELISIKSIGEHKADLILNYLALNECICIDELENINGIGEETIVKIKKHWR